MYTNFTCFTIDGKKPTDKTPAKEITAKIEVTSADNLIKGLSHMRNTLFSFEYNELPYDFFFEYYTSDNYLEFGVIDSNGEVHDFAFFPPDGDKGNAELDDFLRFLNQNVTPENRKILTEFSDLKEFAEIWARDLIFFHTSFSTSNRKVVGINGDFYTSPSVLYPPPTNESTFYLRFTSDGHKNILIRHCVFIMQVTFIINFMKTKIL